MAEKCLTSSSDGGNYAVYKNQRIDLEDSVANQTAYCGGTSCVEAAPYTGDANDVTEAQCFQHL